MINQILLKKELLKKIVFKNIKIDPNVTSVTFVGSFITNNKINFISDVDVVVIVKKLDKKVFDKINNKIKKIKPSKIGLTGYKIKINNTFGPLKYKSDTDVVIHLMIYDKNGHIDHVIKSPFTCYDWERSLVFNGKRLRDIFPVGAIQFRDFLETRRSLQNYLKDLKKSVLTYYQYSFYKNKYKFIKKQKLLFDSHLAEYIFHIHKNLINNYYKYLFNKNVSLNDNYIFFLKKIIGKELYFKFIKHFKLFYNYKKTSTLNFCPRKETAKLNSFLSNFNKSIKKNIKTSNKIIFYRHAETTLNNGSFLGIGRDPGILSENINNLKDKNTYKYFIFYSSLLKRSIDTAKLIFKQKKIIKLKELNEINYGLAEGLNFSELKKKYPRLVKKWVSGDDPKFPRGESYNDVLSRLDHFIYKILKYKIKNKKQKVIGVMSHNVFLRCLIGSYFKIDKANWYKIYIPHLCPLEFIFHKNEIRPNIPRNILRIIFSKL